jgi:hypothetical protein
MTRVFKILFRGKASCRTSLADHLNCSMNLRQKAAQNPQPIKRFGVKRLLIKDLGIYSGGLKNEWPFVTTSISI